jgi:hypothetical protein
MITYLFFPKYAHRFVGYLEEEAVHTYSKLLQSMDSGKMKEWTETKAPREAIEYYNLSADAKMRDVILCVRADEVFHREYNHHFADVPHNADIE